MQTQNKEVLTVGADVTIIIKIRIKITTVDTLIRYLTDTKESTWQIRTAYPGRRICMKTTVGAQDNISSEQWRQSSQ